MADKVVFPSGWLAEEGKFALAKFEERERRSPSASQDGKAKLEARRSGTPIQMSVADSVESDNSGAD